MKVLVAYTIEVNDTIRRGIRMHYGLDGLASRQEVQAWYRQHGEAGDDDLVWEVQKEEDEQPNLGQVAWELRQSTGMNWTDIALQLTGKPLPWGHIRNAAMAFEEEHDLVDVLWEDYIPPTK